MILAINRLFPEISTRLSVILNIIVWLVACWTLVNSVSTENQCSFHDIVANFSSDEICNGNVDIYQDVSNASLPYLNCRLINGFVSLRRLNSSFNASFPNLEVIRDFVLLYDIDLGSNNLSQLFPRLRIVLGHRRILNYTMYTAYYSNYERTFQIDSLQRVCGPFTIKNSSEICFRYSQTYWNLMSAFRNSQYFTSSSEISRDDVIIVKQMPHSVFVNFQLHYDIPLRKLSHLQVIRLSYYEINDGCYHYLQNGTRIEPSCTKALKKNETTFLRDLNYYFKGESLSEHVQKYVDDIFDNNSTLDNETFIFNVYDVQEPLDSSYQRRIDSIDVQSRMIDAITHFTSQSAYSSVEEFRLDHFYFIKVDFCQQNNHHICQFHRNFSFRPTYEEYGLSKFQTELTNYTIQIPSWSIFLLMTLATLIIILIIVLAVGLYRKKRSKLRYKPSWSPDVISPNPEYGLIKHENSIWSWSSLFQSSPYIDTVNCEINRSKLLILPQRILGKGEFGFVYEGILFDYDVNTNTNLSCACNNNCSVNYSHQNSTRVAIKQLKQDANRIDKEKFITEAKYMKTFNSNFLVKLIGVCSIDEPIMVIMEYMENGDLKRFLRERYLEYQRTHDSNLLPSFDGVTSLAIQIADGMHYLHSKKIIHRDLAARNCMVGGDFNVKIGDFGLTRDLYEKDYYRLSEEAPLPLRWMAPESVSKMIFTPASDVWSYGVVLWEILCFGEQPYRGKSDQEVKHLIANCERLPRPMHYFEEIWNLMKQCWSKNPKSRPSFKKIIDYLYPLLPNRDNFDAMSYYSSNGANYERFTLREMLFENCFEFLAKYSNIPLQQRQNNLNYRRCRRDTDISIQFSNNANRCPVQFCSNNIRNNGTHICKSRARCCRSISSHNSCANQHIRRYQSTESLQSAVCSEITAITSLSSNYEPNGIIRLPTTDEEVALI